MRKLRFPGYRDVSDDVWERMLVYPLKGGWDDPKVPKRFREVNKGVFALSVLIILVVLVKYAAGW